MTDRERIVKILMHVGFGLEGANIAADALLANGVIVPPCKVRQTLWRGWYAVEEFRVSGLTQKADGSWKIRLTSLRYRGVFEITVDELEKEYFFNRKDAEKALEGMKQ